ncbi:electron transfer flavoprotein subunit alpha/FixB family protein [Galactobacter sp.]|uniref:electron transfer flavoprotein subunit alpha/FixB family protein n=1 Tax=Galactobacter sp. TaxID=2676125 RepID=UPI0025BA11D4|nr:electron transfer flavoprotein subunit alpha/FixB family protein [Galactobacter sp.]
MSSIVYLDSIQTPLSTQTRELVGLGTLLGDLMVVSGSTPSAEALAALGDLGVSHVIVAEGDVDQSLAVGQGELLRTAAAELEARVVLAPAQPAETEVVARAAALDGSAIITGAQTVAPDLSVSKPVLSGTGYTVVRPTTATAYVTVLPGASAAATSEGAGPAELYPLPIEAPAAAARLLARTPISAGGRPDLETADVVVAGGRGTEGDFTAVEQLADALGAAIGASRVAADEGWIGHESQVGQTGRSVAPDLYVAAGISGAVQHVVGLRQAGTIVAVNTDEDAPIFEIADFGIVGKLQDVLPQAVEEIIRRRG